MARLPWPLLRWRPLSSCPSRLSFCFRLTASPYAPDTCLLELRRSKDRPLHSPTWPGYFFRTRQDPGSVRGDRYRVLEMSRRLAVRGFRDPFVPHVHVGLSGVHHRFDGDDHALLQSRAAAWVAIVREIGLVVHLRTDAVPDKLSHYRIPVLFDPALDCVADIA